MCRRSDGKLNETGILYLVGTPIGNLGDLSKRAAQILDAVAIVAAEDTRHTGLLLNRIGVHASMISFHTHNEAKRVPEILAALGEGKDVAVVSDAGNPGISDPAERLVRAAVEAGCDIVPIPGPSAFLTALVASGLPAGRFRFEGFLPARETARREALRSLRAESETIIFYESPKRVRRLIDDIIDVLGDRRVVLARELTKKFEEFFRGPASEAAEHLDAAPPRGEFVVLVEGASRPEPLPTDRVLDLVREEVRGGRSLRDSVRAASRVALWNQQDVYRLAREKEISG